MDSNTTSLLFDAWTTKASKVPELAPSQIVHDEDYYGYVVADAHNKLQQQFQPTSHNIYQFPAQLPAGPQFQQAAQAQLFAVVKLGDTTTMAHLPHHQQEPPPPYSVFAPADQQMFYPPSHQFPLSPHQQAAFFGGGCGGSNLQNLLNEAQQQAMKQICDGGSQRQHIPKLSAIRFDGAPETAAAVTGENLWSNRVRSTAAEQQQQPRKPGQRHSNKHKSTAKEDQPQQKKQHPLSILKKPVTTTTTVEGLQIASAPQTPNRPIGFNPIEPVDKKKVNSGKSLIEQKEDNQQKAKLSGDKEYIYV
jgi:hypothetical protein